MMEPGNALDIVWSYGYNKDVIGSVHSLSTSERNAIFFLASHSGVIYDFEHRKQTILQGHCNIITCCAIDPSKRWIVTGDVGEESIMIVWDSLTYMPVKTFIMPHDYGIKALDISTDGMYIVTIGATRSDRESEQEIAIWAWTSESDQALARTTFSCQQGSYISVHFNPQDIGQIVTTSPNEVRYWHWQDYILESYIGMISRVDLGHFSGEMTDTIYYPGTEIALTSTSHGYIILWEIKNELNQTTKGLTKEFSRENTHNGPSLRTAVKVIRLIESGINVMSVSFNGYLVLGCQDGAIRFYDSFLRLEAWFEDLDAGAIHSLSFSIQQNPYGFNEGGTPGLKFWVPDFIVGTNKAFIVGVESSLFDEIKKEDRRGMLLMQGMSDVIVDIQCHPRQPLLAILCSNGTLQIWNYELKLLLILKEFHLLAKCCCFHPMGNGLLIAFGNGMIKLVSVDTLEELQVFSPSIHGITKLAFSYDGEYFASADESFHVALFQKNHEQTTKDKNNHYQYIGRSSSHSSRITGLSFGYREHFPTLISVGEDRYCIEYDLQTSSILTGLIARKIVLNMTNDGAYHEYSSRRIESTATPLALLWHPKQDDEIEDIFITINNEFKYKAYNVDSKQCRKTCLAPRYGYPPNILALIPESHFRNQGHYLYAFSTSYKVIGIGSFPLDGNPTKSSGIVAHPNQITGLCVSYDGNYVFSAGGSDLTVNMWDIVNAPKLLNPIVPNIEEASTESKQIIQQNKLEDQEMDVFFNLLEGGKHGELHANIVDYFYYCQLRHGGEDTIEARQLSGAIPLEEIPAVMRAVGYYPSEEEIMNMINEIRYKQYLITGITQDTIRLNELIKLYINHRPVIPLDQTTIQQAFETISSKLNLHANEITWDTLKSILTHDGEMIQEEDLDTYLGALLGEINTTNSYHKILSEQPIDSWFFGAKILGFEEN